MFLRSFAVQGSWNYRTLIGAGFAFALLPALRVIYRDRPDELRAAVQRHVGLFNSHPYLVPMALGAVAVLEQTENPLVIERFKSAVRGSLGSLGDRIVWAGWRPVCVLVALLMVALGSSWLATVLVFLLLYNTGHVLLRIYALHAGTKFGKQLGEQLRAAPVERVQRILQRSGTFLIGVLLPLLVTGRTFTVELPAWWLGIAVLAVVTGARFGAAVRLPLVGALTLLTLIGFALEVIP